MGLQLQEDRLQEFFDTAYERQEIYLEKEVFKFPPPWTTDPIFKKYRFCNVFRHLDKTTKYIKNSVIKPNEKNPDLWKGILVSRFFSRIETIEFLLKEGCLFENHGLAIELLKDLQTKQPIMTSAFILNPLQINGKYYPKFYTPFYICKMLGACVDIDSKLKKFKTIKEFFNLFKKLPSTAGFMAYEYATDFTYSKRYFPNPPIDKYTFGNFTIGSLRGLKRLLGLRPDQTTRYLNIEHWTIEILRRWREDVNKRKITNSYFNDLSMREVEHWLCEYDKYMRIKNGEAKRLKRRYKYK